MFRRMLLTTLSCFIAGAIPALAQTPTPGGTPGGMGACRLESRALCRGVEAGQGRRIACLAQNMDKLSAPCADVVKARQAQAPAAPSVPPAASAPPASPAPQTAQPPATAPSAAPPAAMAQDAIKGAVPAGGNGNRRGAMAVCRSDIKAFCDAVPSGGGARMKCLTENLAKASPACQQAVAGQKQVKAAANAACKADARTVCPGLKGAERRACFAENKAKISQGCADSLAAQLAGKDKAAVKDQPPVKR